MIVAAAAVVGATAALKKSDCGDYMDDADYDDDDAESLAFVFELNAADCVSDERVPRTRPRSHSAPYSSAHLAWPRQVAHS